MAVIALTYYGFLTMGVLKIMDATLMLPGIAGLILTLGMAVDANIIIVVRIKKRWRKVNLQTLQLMKLFEGICCYSRFKCDHTICCYGPFGWGQGRLKALL